MSPNDREYSSDPQFRQQMEAIFESFTGLRDDVEQEKRAMQRIWAEREQQIDHVLPSDLPRFDRGTAAWIV